MDGCLGSKHFLLSLVLLSVVGIVTSSFYVAYKTPADCIRQSIGAATSYYFDSNSLKCVQCSQPAAYQKTSTDGKSLRRVIYDSDRVAYFDDSAS
jgi:hypothetical protein